VKYNKNGWIISDDFTDHGSIAPTKVATYNFGVEAKAMGIPRSQTNHFVTEKDDAGKTHIIDDNFSIITYEGFDNWQESSLGGTRRVDGGIPGNFTSQAKLYDVNGTLLGIQGVDNGKDDKQAMILFEATHDGLILKRSHLALGEKRLFRTFCTITAEAQFFL